MISGALIFIFKLCLVLIHPVGLAWLWCMAKSKHDWDYHNPYNRKCRQCHRHEVEHYWAEEHPTRDAFWEVFDDGDGSCYKK